MTVEVQRDEGGAEAANTFKRRVTRDHTFARYTIDSSTVHPIGSDLEIAMLSLSPTLRETEWRSGSTQPVSQEVGGGVAELCRVRLDAEAANNMAFNLLLMLVRLDEITVDVLEKNVDILKKLIEAGEAEGE